MYQTDIKSNKPLKTSIRTFLQPYNNLQFDMDKRHIGGELKKRGLLLSDGMVEGAMYGYKNVYQHEIYLRKPVVLIGLMYIADLGG